MTGLKVPKATTVSLSLHYPALTVKVLENVAEYIRKQHGIDVEDSTIADDIARQIAEQIKPTKPTEPTGLGAVVEDADGRKWVRVPGDEHDPAPWDASPTDRFSRPWSGIDVVRVLSKGVS